MTVPAYIVRKARISDVKAMHHLLMQWSADGMLLPRSLNHLYTHVRDFFVLCEVVEQNERVIGCCALTIMWENLAEICSLAVERASCHHGHGRRLLDAAADEARELGLTQLFALTYQEAFFTKMGFHVVGKDTLPQKVWTDCINCPKFPDCDETAVLRVL